MNILKTIKKLEELDKAATPGPWLSFRGDSYCAFPVVKMEKTDHVVYFEGFAERNGLDEDSDLVAKSRNALPEILEFCKEAMGNDQAIAGCAEEALLFNQGHVIKITKALQECLRLANLSEKKWGGAE